ncbi:ubiquinol-cytochrome c reductase iron-sulfur subunit [Emticicia sp.]|uniref:QcrA and Rieske domain-containing protein n=1 Tax=Emticicia sp. TaxID=1930953 RepID=UPI0037517840
MEQTQLSRGQFLRQLGMSSAALMSFYCLGTTMTACTSASDDPMPAPTTPPTPITPPVVTPPAANSGITGMTTGSIDFTIDLLHPDFKKLKTEGEFTYVADIIIANAKGTFVALSKVCTHQGTTIDFRPTANDFKCPNHGSEFTTDGKVQKSPATTALKVYKAESINSGNSLKISA